MSSLLFSSFGNTFVSLLLLDLNLGELPHDLCHFKPYLYVCACVWLGAFECNYFWRPEEGEIPPRAGIIGSCERTDVSTGE